MKKAVLLLNKPRLYCRPALPKECSVTLSYLPQNISNETNEAKFKIASLSSRFKLSADLRDGDIRSLLKCS